MAYTPPVGTVDLSITGSYTPATGTVNLSIGATSALIPNNETLSFTENNPSVYVNTFYPNNETLSFIENIPSYRLYYLEKETLTWTENNPSFINSISIPSASINYSANSTSGHYACYLSNETLSFIENSPYLIDHYQEKETLTWTENDPSFMASLGIPLESISYSEHTISFSYVFYIPEVDIGFTASDVNFTFEAAIDNLSIVYTANRPFIRVSTTHTATYSTICIATHRANYESVPIVATHAALWSTLAQQIHTSIYQTPESIFNTHTATYLSDSSASVSQTHTALWSSASLAAISAIHESLYQATTSIYNTHTVLYASVTAVFAYHEVLFRSNNQVSSINTALYQSIPLIYSCQTTSYQSVVSDFAIHLATYQQVPNNYTTHTARYRSASMDAQAILANAYIEPAIQIVSAQVTADEDSPYYQCEVELLNSSDYRNFVRDQAFTLHLFDDSYAFVVDSKGLSRSIDEAGNYQEVATISGLSPLCLKASPRSEPVTKTWDSATYASAIVTELIGTVTWNLVDWQIPAYRLAIEKADPFEVAQQIVNAAGGLIESQPDGSVVVRHRWPTSIALLDTIVPATTLYENVIYSAQEQPTQDDLMNRIRILDTNASYQDRLEYVANELSDGSDDPWTGWLYAYLSPWRNGLTIATTRGSKIQLGTQVEGTRAIFDDPDDAENIAELITFESGTGSVAYPIQTLSSVTWLDENLGGLTFVPYSTSLEASGRGNYYGYSLAEISYTTRYLKVPVICQESTDTIEAQFLLLENANG